MIINLPIRISSKFTWKQPNNCLGYYWILWVIQELFEVYISEKYYDYVVLTIPVALWI